MNKIRIFIVLVVSIGFVYAGIFLPSRISTSVSIPEKIVQSTVYVETIVADGLVWGGSGVIVDENGLIMTAGHMISNAASIKVTLFNGKEYQAVSFYCKNYPDADVGFIKIDAVNLPTLKLKNSNLNYGDVVYICGCPFGNELAFTLTKGIVAGFNRKLEGLGEKSLLQVDAQAWPGNSGGPVCNEKGEIIGILIGSIPMSDGISLCTTADIAIIALAKYKLDMIFENIK